MNIAHHAKRLLLVAMHTTICTAMLTLPLLAKTPTIKIDYQNIPLMDVINSYTTKLGINILPPQGKNPLSQKVTFSLPDPIPLHQAIDYLETILTVAGYALSKDNNLYRINKVDKNLARKPVPVFVNASDKIPDSPQEICAIHTFNNLQVPSASNRQSAEVYKILKELLTANANIFFDQKANSMIIFDQANSLKVAIEVIKEFDVLKNEKKHIIIKPKYIDASTFAQLVHDDIVQAGQPDGSSFGAPRNTLQAKDQFIDSSTNVFAEPRTNRIIALGTVKSLNNLKLLMVALDKPHKRGRSVLHVKKLKYLDATKFAPLLTNIISPPSGGDQSTAIAGTTQEFRGVIIQAEGYKTTSGDDDSSESWSMESDSSSGIQQGGNNLIIAAYDSDYAEIEAIIDRLDTPEPQIIIETLIVDLLEKDSKSLGSNTRPPTAIGLPDTVGFQAANLLPPITEVKIGDTTTIVGPTTDLLPESSTTLAGITSSTEIGSTIAALGDSTGVWALFKALRKNDNAKIIAHPFGITKNNKKLHLHQGTTKRVAGASASDQTVATTIAQIDLSASIKINVVPRVTAGDRINLNVSVTVDEFQPGAGDDGDTSQARNSRIVTTNSTIKSGDILPIGGLIKVTESDSIKKTPVLGSLPLIGMFFSARGKTTEKHTLEIYISATVVDHNYHANAHKFTDYQVQHAGSDFEKNGVFGGKKQPVTRLFFKGVNSHDSLMRGFLDRGYNTKGMPLMPQPPGSTNSDPRNKNPHNYDPTLHRAE
jgi:general secretion pathway protein D